VNQNTVPILKDKQISPRWTNHHCLLISSVLGNEIKIQNVLNLQQIRIATVSRSGIRVSDTSRSESGVPESSVPEAQEKVKIRGVIQRRKRKTTKTKLDIRTVAENAHVSIATVSRVINAVPSVSPELAQRVWSSIEELNYFPNTQARGLVSGHSRIFGLIVPEITNPFFPELIQGFEEIAVDNGYEILVSSTNNDLKRLVTCVRRMLERKVEGVAVMTFGMEEPVLEQLTNRNVPLVLAEFPMKNPRMSTLLLDYQRGIGEGVKHLYDLGHRKIAFISGPITLHSALSRSAAFANSMRELGLQVRKGWMIEGDHTPEGGVRACKELASKKPLPTAIMCSNDQTAIGVLQAAYHMKLRVPEDISVIGLDDIHFAEFTLPPLTTVRLSRLDVARAAFNALHDQVQENPPSVKRNYAVSTSLVVRSSTAPPPFSDSM
jgi:DNA-binding LacI/PurR family transcriptional regulator